MNLIGSMVLAFLMPVTATTQISPFQTCGSLTAEGFRKIDTWNTLYKEVTQVQEDYFKFLSKYAGGPDKLDEISSKFAEDFSVAICPTFLRVRGKRAHQTNPCYYGNPKY